MRISKIVKKKKAAFCAVAMMTLPLLVGFKVGEENTEEVKSKVEENADTKKIDANSNNENTLKIDNKKSFDTNQNKNENSSPSLSTNYNPYEETDNNSQIDSMVKEYMEKYNGKTIVDIKFEGAGDATLPTVKAAVLEHVGDTFDAEFAMRDLNSIKNTGYFYDAYPTFEEIPEGILITYHMLENPVLQEIVFTGNTVVKTEDLQEIMTVPRGEILNSNTLHDNIAAVQEKYRGDGYIMMKVSDMNIAKDGVLTLKINEGILEGYKVKGNKKTKDKVILREMRQKVGEPFNAKLARRSMQRVYNLGFFEDVNIKMPPGREPNSVIMEIDVKEKRTGNFSVGAGYSSRDGLIGMITISDKNFRGTGDAVAISYETSADDTDAHGFAFSYRHPWIDSKETAGTIRIYNRTYEYADYDTQGDLKERYMRRYTGGELTLSRPMSEYSTNYITIRQRKDSYVRHVSNGNAGDRSGPAGESWRNKNFGLTRSIIFQHITDTRDNIYAPTTGNKVSLTGEFGGLIGGDFNFQKLSIEHQSYRPAGSHSQVWAFRAGYGIGFGDLTEFNEYKVGGQDSLRGYRDDQYRGSRMTLATLEYRFPLAKKVQGALFTDWGAAWDSGFIPKNINGSVGLGVALNTPLGPLRLDYGRGRQKGRFHFSVGGSF